MTRGLRMAPPPRPQRGTAVDNDSVGPLQRQYDRAKGARPKNRIPLRREYVILDPEEPARGTVTAGTQVRGAGHISTRGMEDQGWTGTETEDKTSQCALLECGMQENGDEEQSSPERQLTLNVCSHQGGEGGGDP